MDLNIEELRQEATELGIKFQTNIGLTKNLKRNLLRVIRYRRVNLSDKELQTLKLKQVRLGLLRLSIMIKE